jgi:RinA family phage transcriptional activator
VFKFVEHELYNYEDTKKELRDLKDDIAESSLGNMELDNFSSTEKYPEGSSTETAVATILQNKVAKRMSSTIKYIDKTLGKLDESKAELYVLKYQQEKPWQQIIKELHISKRTFFRWRKDIVRLVAKEMGLIQ